jgi:hypothetical protein
LRESNGGSAAKSESVAPYQWPSAENILSCEASKSIICSNGQRNQWLASAISSSGVWLAKAYQPGVSWLINLQSWRNNAKWRIWLASANGISSAAGGWLWLSMWRNHGVSEKLIIEENSNG